MRVTDRGREVRVEELRRIREERGMSQGDLAAASGVDRVTINQVERGRRKPSLGTLEKLAAALGVEMADLFPKAQAPLPLDIRESKASGAMSPVDAAAVISDLVDMARELAAAWHRDVEFYEEHGRELWPLRTLEMGSTVVVLYQKFWAALEALQRHAQQLGRNPDISTWEPRSRELLLESGSSIRALAQLYEVIERGAANPDANRDDFRAMREEFDVRVPEALTSDPQWPTALEKARTAIGVAQ
jgi:transcriptional regulator with XRE-family HTH domain